MAVGEGYMNVDGTLLQWYWQGKTDILGENCPSTAFSTTNLKWPVLRMNQGLVGERPATNRLSHGLTLYHHSNIL
jgi:hypothetical protein